MTSFKLAAIKILRKAKEPMQYKDITDKAIEESLIETTGQTPAATMNAQMAVDIKVKKNKSAFVRVKPGYFSLNPNFSKEDEKEEEREEEVREVEMQEAISTQYTGSAGEHRVLSELLFHGFNASIMSVDEGMDIVATKDNHLYNIQVKTANESNNVYVFDLRKTSFERYNKNNNFYIFVLRGKEVNFLVLPYVEVKKNIHQKNILSILKNTRYRVNVKIRDGKLYLGKLENDMSYYMNNWSVLK